MFSCCYHDPHPWARVLQLFLRQRTVGRGYPETTSQGVPEGRPGHWAIWGTHTVLLWLSDGLSISGEAGCCYGYMMVYGGVLNGRTPKSSKIWRFYCSVFEVLYRNFFRNLHMGVSENWEPKNPPDHLFVFLIPSTKWHAGKAYPIFSLIYVAVPRLCTWHGTPQPQSQGDIRMPVEMRQKELSELCHGCHCFGGVVHPLLGRPVWIDGFYLVVSDGSYPMSLCSCIDCFPMSHGDFSMWIVG